MSKTKTKRKLVKSSGRSKYKQLNISTFFVSTHKNSICLLNNKMDFNDSPPSSSKKKKVLKRKLDFTKSSVSGTESECTDVDYILPFPLPHYKPPEEEDAIVISDEEIDVIPNKYRMLDVEHPNGTNTLKPQRSILRLKKMSDLIQIEKHSIGVFLPSKVNLLWDKSKPRMLQEKSSSNRCLTMGTFVSDNRRDEIETPTVSATINVPVPQNKVNPSVADLNTGLNSDYYLRNMKQIYDFVTTHPRLSKLLGSNEIRMLNVLLNQLDEKYGYFCIRMFMRIQKWNNIFKLKSDMKLNMSEAEVKTMYECLLDHDFVVSDISMDPPIELLNLLTVSDIKDLCKSFKLQTGRQNKSALINKLLDNCNHQSILISFKNTKTILIERIQKKMGICIKLSSNLYSVLEKIHLLYSFTTKDFKNNSDMYFFLNRKETGEITIPKYRIDKDTTVFRSIEEFESYSEAEECRKAMILAFDKKQRNDMLELCNIAYDKLCDIDYSSQDINPSHLFRFTPVYIYTKALWFGIQFLTKHQPQHVEEFLLFLLKKKTYFKSMCGSWYDTLVMVQYNHLKHHEMAAETIIEALADENLTESDRFLLNNRASNIKKNKSNKLSKLVSDRICFAQANSNIPFIEIDAKTISVERATGRKFYIENIDGEIIVRTVEEIGLNHYFKEGYKNGMHCEGSLLWTIFFILLWDAIYDDNIPHVFISDMQYLPLDFYSKDFYLNRKDRIDKILNNVDHLWNNQQLAMKVGDNWRKHSHKKSLISTSLDLDPTKICEIIMCITPQKLVEIFRRLLSDMRGYRSGLPDIFIWNSTTKACKFVEVKSQKDKLSNKQEIWLRFLKSIGCAVEVCHVHSIGNRSRVHNKKKQ